MIPHSDIPFIQRGLITKNKKQFLDTFIGAGLLMIAGLLAIIMSTQDSFLNTTSSLISHDICKQIYPSLTDKQELLIARFSCVASHDLDFISIFKK